MKKLTPDELRSMVDRKDAIAHFLENVRFSVAVERPGSDLWQAYQHLMRAEGDLRRLLFELLRRGG